MHFISLVISALRGQFLSIFYQKKIKRAGRFLKFFHSRYYNIGEGFCVGDYCWLEAVKSYRGLDYQPSVVIGENVKLSDNVHISAVHSIRIGSGVLIGSNVYIGDHSHGATKNVPDIMLSIPPAERYLADLDEITIGSNVWIGNGAVILAGSHISDGSIVGANTVVKGKFMSRAIIAGIPAKEVRKI